MLLGASEALGPSFAYHFVHAPVRVVVSPEVEPVQLPLFLLLLASLTLQILLLRFLFINGKLKEIEPDSKSQVTMKYENNKPVKVTSIVISVIIPI